MTETLVDTNVLADTGSAGSRWQAWAIGAPARFRRDDPPWQAAFLTGREFLAYRPRAGVRASPLPDFFIGAHAAVRGNPLPTRDGGYDGVHFPTLTISREGGP